MAAININSNTYMKAVTTASVAITLTESDSNLTSIVIYNAGTTPLFAVTGASAPTAVFPTSATVPVNGSLIPAGVTLAFTKNPAHANIALIRGSGTGDAFLSVGYGE